MRDKKQLFSGGYWNLVISNQRHGGKNCHYKKLSLENNQTRKVNKQRLAACQLQLRMLVCVGRVLMFLWSMLNTARKWKEAGPDKTCKKNHSSSELRCSFFLVKITQTYSNHPCWIVWTRCLFEGIPPHHIAEAAGSFYRGIVSRCLSNPRTCHKK